MKAYKVEIIVVDHGGHGPEELKTNLEQMRYYSPDVIGIMEADIDEWYDQHPLNLRSTPLEEKLLYFKS